MKNSQKKILILGLSLAGILLAILYSPIGSPGMYSQGADVSVYINQGVDFSGGVPVSGSTSGGQGFSIDKAFVTDVPLSANNFLPSNIPPPAISLKSNALAKTNMSSAPVLTSKLQVTSVASSSSFGFFGVSKNTSKNIGTGSKSLGFTSLSSRLSETGKNALPQAAPDATTDGGPGVPDPGGDPDPTTELPIPDGLSVLFLLSGLYAVFKSEKILRLKVYTLFGGK